MKESNPYRYALDFLGKLNAFVRSHPEIAAHFQRGGYDFWSFYQQQIFDDIRRWHEAPDTLLGKPASIKRVATDLFLIVFSLYSAVITRARRIRVLVYSVDRLGGIHANDPRLNDVYEALAVSGERFIELFHTVPGRKTFAAALTRRRAAFYLEAIDAAGRWASVFSSTAPPAPPLPESDTFNEREAVFAKSMLKKYAGFVRISEFRLRVLRALLRFLRARVVLSIDDGRHTFELFAAARAEGVRSTAFQHGHFTRYHVGWLSQWEESDYRGADELVVWSTYWRDELVRLGSFYEYARIRVGVPSRFPRFAEKSNEHTKPTDTPFTVLLPYESVGPRQNVAVFVRALLRSPDVRIIFKLRTDVPKDIQLKEYGFSEKELNERFCASEHVENLLPRVSIALGVYSTYLYDMVLRGIPVGVLQLGWDYGNGMVENGLAAAVPESACSVPALATSLPKAGELVRRRTLLLGSDHTPLAERVRVSLKA